MTVHFTQLLHDLCYGLIDVDPLYNPIHGIIEYHGKWPGQISRFTGLIFQPHVEPQTIHWQFTTLSPNKAEASFRSLQFVDCHPRWLHVERC